jgi:MATE family multidrug resistance protein
VARSAAAGFAPGHREILSIALPAMLCNLSTPLIGLVDTGVVGRLGEPAHIGAVALGALLFTGLFWAFGFLRMGTSGLTAQALGAGDAGELRAALGRALALAAAAGIALIALQVPIRAVSFSWLAAGPRVEVLAREYFDMRIWSAPAALANYALLGWFVGLGRTGLALSLQLVLGAVNLSLALVLGLALGGGVRGVALAAVLAELSAAAAGIVLALRCLRSLGAPCGTAALLDPRSLRRTLAVNGDILIRSLALLAASGWFAVQGARQGEQVLAANAILLHFVSASSYLLDGLAFAAEALVGRALGAADRSALIVAARRTTAWAAASAALISLALAGAGPQLIDWLALDPGTRATAREYLPWSVAAPLLGVWAYQLDGIFIGATRGPQLRNAMLAALAIFGLGWWALAPYGNHGLWAALYVHYVARSASLLCYYPGLLRSAARRASS